MAERETDIRRGTLESFDNAFLPGNANLDLIRVADAVAFLRAHQDTSEPNTFADDAEVTLMGRVVLKRNAGKIVFATIRGLDRGEHLLQVFLNPQNIAAEQVSHFKENVHIGDILYVTGRLGYSSTHELTLHVFSWEMASKALNPVPKMTKNPETGELEHSLNKQTQHDDPVLHLMTSKDHRNSITVRAVMIRAIRRYFEDTGFLEVDTPVLSTHAGGASAAKFTTESNALGDFLYLRIAPELYLKRLVIGGMGNVFELGKNFRNEGIDSTHSPEFMALEAYKLNSDYLDQLQVTIGAIRAAWLGFADCPVDELVVVKFFDALNAELGEHNVQVSPNSDPAKVRDIFRSLRLEVPSAEKSLGELLEDLFDELVVPAIRNAVVCVMDMPTDTSPLAYPNGDGTSQKWDLYIGGLEIATAYTENTDPLLQAETLTEDMDFVHDVQYGLPPLGGLGIGIDRLAMILTGSQHINGINHHPHSAV